MKNVSRQVQQKTKLGLIKRTESIVEVSFLLYVSDFYRQIDMKPSSKTYLAFFIRRFDVLRSSLIILGQ